MNFRGKVMPKAMLALLAGTMIATASIATANAQGCSFDEVELSCGDGKPESVLSAMASAETADLFANPLDGLEKFKHPFDLEKFRRSVEANWRSVNKAEAAQRRKMRKREISAAEFDEWSKTYQFALNNYSAALTYYRTLVWHGKTGKAAPEG